MAEVVGSDLGGNNKKPRWRTILLVVGILVVAGGAGVGLRLFQNEAEDDKGNDGQVTGQPLPGDAEKIQNMRVSGDEDEASKLIDKELNDSSTPDSERYILFIQRGNIAFDKKDYNGAIDAYMDAYDVKVTFEITRLIAESYALAGNKQQAIVYYKKALPLVPASPVQDEDKKVIEKKIHDLEG